MKKGDFEGFTLQEIQGELTVFPMLLPEASEIPEGELFSRLWKNSGGALLRQSVESKKKKLSREIRQNLKRTRHQIRTAGRWLRGFDKFAVTVIDDNNTIGVYFFNGFYAQLDFTDA